MRGAIVHLEEVANEWNETLSDDDLVWPCTVAGMFYSGQGNYELALPWYQKCLEQCKQRFGTGHPDVSTSLNNLAYLYYSQGRYEEAKPLFKEALEMCRKLLGNEHPSVATSLLNFGVIYQQQGKNTEAEAHYHQAIAIAEATLGPNHPNTLTMKRWLSSLPQSSD